MKKKILTIFMFCILFLSKDIFAGEKISNISSTHIGVYTVNNFRALYEENSREKIPIASITKIMTAIVCIENVGNLKENVIIDLPQVQKYYDEDYATAGLKDKQEISYYDLIATMLIPSGADSAATIALNVFGDYDTYINAMNKKAKELGMTDTCFSNPIGSDDEKNYSNVYDVALMMKYALENEMIKELMTIYEYTIEDGSITVHNALFQLANIYGINVDKISGGKTGMTEDAGYCLASYSEKLEEPIICVVLGSEIKRGTLYHLSDSQKVYEFIEDEYSFKNIINMGDEVKTLPTYHSTVENASVCATENVQYFCDNDEEINYDNVEVKYEGADTISYKNKKGDIIGKASIYYNGMYIKDIDLVLSEKINFSVYKWIKDNSKISMVILIIVAMFCFYIYARFKIKNKCLRG